MTAACAVACAARAENPLGRWVLAQVARREIQFEAHEHVVRRPCSMIACADVTRRGYRGAVSSVWSCAFCSPLLWWLMGSEQKANMLNARAHVESLLRARHLDRTLSPPWESGPTARTQATGIEGLDRVLGGGFPLGQISEVVGARSSGRSGLVCTLLASATRRGDLVALVDTADEFDPVCAHHAGVQLPRVLWVRGQANAGQVAAARRLRHDGGVPRLTHATRAGVRAERAATDLVGVALDRAVKAMHLLVQAGHFSVVVLDCANLAPHDLQRLPFTTWRRLQRAIEGTTVAGVVVAPVTGARSAGGITLSLQQASRRVRWKGTSARARLFDGLELQALIGRARQVPMAEGVSWHVQGFHE